jgi:hypothetical protein
MTERDLKVIEPEPLGKGIMATLDYFRSMAERDELSSVVVVAVLRSGAPEWKWSDAPNTSTLLGAVERMKIAMIVQKDVS